MEDLVLEKEFLSKIDVPLKILLLSLLFTPFIGYLPHFLVGIVSKLALFIIPLLFVHMFAQGFDLIVFRWYFEKHKEANLPAVFRAIVISLMYIISTLILLQHVFGLNILPVIATSTVMTAVLGLALQDTLKNLFAGLTLSLEKRFKQGDWISFKPDSVTLTVGEISEIGWRTIRIRTLDNNYSIIPNGTFTSANITNFSRPKPCYVRAIEFPVAAGASVPYVSDVLRHEILSVEGVLPTPAPEVTPISVKLDQVVFRLRFWIDNFPLGEEIAGKVIEKAVSRLQYEKLITTGGPATEAVAAAAAAVAMATAVAPSNQVDVMSDGSAGGATTAASVPTVTSVPSVTSVAPATSVPAEAVVATPTPAPAGVVTPVKDSTSSSKADSTHTAGESATKGDHSKNGESSGDKKGAAASTTGDTIQISTPVEKVTTLGKGKSPEA